MKTLLSFLLLVSLPSYAEDDDRYGRKAAGQKAADKVYQEKGNTAVQRKILDETEAQLLDAYDVSHKSLTQAKKDIAKADEEVRQKTGGFNQMNELLKSADEMITERTTTRKSIKNPDGLEDFIKTLDKQIADLKRARENNQAGYDVAKDRLAQANKSLDTARNNQQQAEIALAKNKKAREQFTAQAVKQREAMEVVEEKAAEARRAEEGLHNDAIEGLRGEIKALTLGQNLSELKNTIGKLTDKAEVLRIQKLVLEETLNKAAVGVFMRQKLEGLLTDKEFCQAAKECPNHKPNLNHLFSSVERDRVKGESKGH